MPVAAWRRRRKHWKPKVTFLISRGVRARHEVQANRIREAEVVSYRVYGLFSLGLHVGRGSL